VTPEENKKLAMRFFDEVMNAGDHSLVKELIADDFVDHEEFPGTPNNRDGVVMWLDAMRAAFPDLKVSALKVIAEGDEVWVHSRMTGTHRGEFLGIPPTDKKFDIEGVDRVRVRNGQAIEHWGVTDLMGLMQQLDLVPLPD
jgi:steroid delta-isomerase-like uncharacterized protein